jgi:hypothetical protein
MSRRPPDQVTVPGAVLLATRAPSVCNSQPWHWLIGSQSVHLKADWARQLPCDTDGRDLLLSCGAVLHHVRVALSGLGWMPRVHRMPNPADPAHLATVELRAREPSEEDNAWLFAIRSRRTDRRVFSSWPVPPRHLKVLIECAAREGVIAVLASDPTERAVVTRAMARAATPDTDHAGGTAHSASTVDTAEIPTDAAELLVLATSADDPLSRLRAGEAASSVLLSATSLGLATCPLSRPLAVAGARSAIRNQLFGGAETPQLIVRIGWAPTAAEPIPLSLRRPFHESITLLPGAETQRTSALHQ